MSDVTYAQMTDEQQLTSLSERKLGKNQIELGIFLMAELGKDAGDVVAILDAIREFNANKRGTTGESTEKRVPVAQQIIQSLEADRDTVDEEGMLTASAKHTYERCISVAGRFA